MLPNVRPTEKIGIGYKPVPPLVAVEKLENLAWEISCTSTLVEADATRF